MFVNTLRHSILLTTLLGCLSAVSAQTILDGYAFEVNNRGFLNQVNVTITRIPGDVAIDFTLSDESGHFTSRLAPGRYRVNCKKDLFYDRNDTITIGADKVYLKAEMRRRPGYLFDATIAEFRETPDQVVDAITNARVEIFNRTTKTPELDVFDNPNAFFQFTFEQGNHYTIMIRKPGYITKRIEVYVNVDGCILCVDGIRELSPGVTENLTEGNDMGTLLANIELEKAKLDKRIAIQNIYYDYDKWFIRADAAKQLDKVVTLMKDNPSLSIELGSHTDSRGRDAYNDTLSQRRAEAAVEYIISEGIDRNRITAKGYGESQLVNKCDDGVKCSEADHQLNRRTELRITKIENDSLERMRWRSLEEIVHEEDFERELKRLGNQKQVKVEALHTGKETGKPGKSGKNDLPEANNSVKLPNLTAEEVAAASAARSLPQSYSGYLIEVLSTKTALTDDAVLFRQYPEVYVRKEKDLFVYYVGKSALLDTAKKYLTNTVLAQTPTAKLVQFTKGVKKYL